jgi:hypothetical protein
MFSLLYGYLYGIIGISLTCQIPSLLLSFFGNNYRPGPISFDMLNHLH